MFLVKNISKQSMGFIFLLEQVGSKINFTRN